MNRLRDQFFPGTGLAGNQDGRTAGRDLRHQIEHAEHAVALADDIGEAIPLLEGALELGVFVDKPLAGDNPLDFDQQLFVVPWLGEVIVSSQLHRLHGRFERPVGCDHEDRRMAVAVADVAQHFHAGLLRHHQIEENQVVCPGFELALALERVHRLIDLITLKIQQRFRLSRISVSSSTTRMRPFEGAEDSSRTRRHQT